MEKTISDFLNKENKEYAMYVIERRAIPSIIDGLKTSQRKIIAEAFNIWRTSKRPLKIFQFAGSIALNMRFHHGNVALEDTIVGMCQDFKNNICLFERDGQFGSMRHPNGYGAARYIGCSLSDITYKLYQDNDLTTTLIDDGFEIEPKQFFPIIPMVIVNGSSGIAVGFASNVLNRNPRDVISSCISYLKTGKVTDQLVPYFKDFSGEIIQDETNNLKWYFRGAYEIANTSTVKITEYCPDMSYEKIEAHLFSLEEKNKIVSYENNSKDSIDITVKFRREDLEKYDDIQLRKLLKLDSSDTENLTVLDENGKLKIFTNVQDIIKYFVDFRIKYYTLRKEKKISELEKILIVLENRIKFIKLVIDNKIKIAKNTKAQIVENLEKLKFLKIDDSYDYLLNMALYSLTIERLEHLDNEYKSKKEELEIIKKTDEKTMFILDLKNLESELKKKKI